MKTLGTELTGKLITSIVRTNVIILAFVVLLTCLMSFFSLFNRTVTKDRLASALPSYSLDWQRIDAWAQEEFGKGRYAFHARPTGLALLDYFEPDHFEHNVKTLLRLLLDNPKYQSLLMQGLRIRENASSARQANRKLAESGFLAWNRSLATTSLYGLSVEGRRSVATGVQPASYWAWLVLPYSSAEPFREVIAHGGLFPKPPLPLPVHREGNYGVSEVCNGATLVCVPVEEQFPESQLIVFTSGSIAQPQLELFREGDYLSRTLTVDRFFSGILTILSLALLLCTLLYAKSRDGLLAWYLVFLSSVLLLFITRFGYFRDLFPELSVRLAESSSMTFTSLAMLSFLEFQLRINAEKSELSQPVMTWKVISSSFCLLLLSLSPIVSPHLSWALGTLIALPSSLLFGFYMTILGVRRKRRNSIRALWATFPMLFVTASIAQGFQESFGVDLGLLGALAAFAAVAGYVLCFGCVVVLNIADSRFEAKAAKTKLAEEESRQIAIRLEQMGYLAVRLSDSLASPLQALKMTGQMLSAGSISLEKAIALVRRNSETMNAKLAELKDFRKFAPVDSLHVQIKDSVQRYESGSKVTKERNPN